MLEISKQQKVTDHWKMVDQIDRRIGNQLFQAHRHLVTKVRRLLGKRLYPAITLNSTTIGSTNWTVETEMTYVDRKVDVLHRLKQAFGEPDRSQKNVVFKVGESEIVIFISGGGNTFQVCGVRTHRDYNYNAAYRTSPVVVRRNKLCDVCKMKKATLIFLNAELCKPCFDKLHKDKETTEKIRAITSLSLVVRNKERF